MTAYKDRESLGGSIIFVANKALQPYKDKIARLSEPVGSVTSRDQIINPASYIDPSMYDDSRAGRLQMESDFKAATYYAEQQEAAYQEWYDSEAQQISRQRAAGLNPDLLGVEAGSSADVSADSSVPGANIPTGDQMALQTASTVINGLGSVMSVFTGVAGIMNAASQIKVNQAHEDLLTNQSDLVKNQADGQFLANIGSYISQSSSALSDMLADEMSKDGFDIDSFYKGDFSNIKALAPSDDPRYLKAFDQVLAHSQKKHVDAYKALNDREQYRKDFLTKKASSYYSDNDDVMEGQLEIIVQAEEELHKVEVETKKTVEEAVQKYVSEVDVSAAAAGFNNVNEYNADYYGSLSGKVMAIFDAALKKCDVITNQATSSVYEYLNDQFDNPLNKFFKGRKSAIGWQILAGSHMGWQDYLASQSGGLKLLKEEIRARVNNLNVNTDLADDRVAIDQYNAETARGKALADGSRQNIRSAISIFVPWIK